MVGKRVIRVIFFSLLNFVFGTLFLYIAQKESDYCESCAHQENSSSIEESEKDQLLIQTFKVVHFNFPEKPEERDKFRNIEFWKEVVHMVPNNADPIPKELIVWSAFEVDDQLAYEFRVKRENRTIHSSQIQFEKMNTTWSFWEPEYNLPDTIKLGVFKNEEFVQAKLSYVKVNLFH